MPENYSESWLTLGKPIITNASRRPNFGRYSISTRDIRAYAYSYPLPRLDVEGTHGDDSLDYARIA